MNKPHMISSAGNLTIIDSVGTGSIAKEGNSSDYGYVLENHGTMALNGIKVTSASSVSSAIENGWYTASDNTTKALCKMTITNSDISQANGSGGLYTIKNDDYGVMVINGGNFTNSTAGAGTVLNWNNLTINGGKFNGASAVRTLKQGELGYEKGNTLINGGTFNGKIDTLPNYSGMQISITGGTFTDKESGAEKYLANGKELDSNGNVVNKSITIIVPSDGGNTTTTPSTDNTKNPSTGANDFVGVAAALAVVSLLGAAAVIRKK